MNNWALILLLLVCVVAVIGFTAGPSIIGQGSASEPETQGALNEFEETLIDENSDVEIGSLI